MSCVKKKVRASLAGLALLLVVLAVVAFLAPRLLDLRHLRDEITAQLSRSVPVKVSGDFANPSVTPLSPSAVGKSLLNMMTRTLKLPMKVIEPAMSKGTQP